MQLFQRFFLIALPLLLSSATHAMDNKDGKPDTIISINDNGVTEAGLQDTNNSLCCPWRASNNNREEQELFINNDDDDNNNNASKYEMTCQLLRSLWCRSKEKEQDLEKQDLAQALLVSDEDNNTDENNNSSRTNKLKIAAANALEILFKLGYASGALYFDGPHAEITFFAQHHTAEAIGRHIKFNNWRIPKYVVASLAFVGLGIGFTALEPYLFEGHDSGALAIGWLTVYKLVNNYFNQLNRIEESVEHHDENHDEHHDAQHQD